MFKHVLSGRPRGQQSRRGRPRVEVAAGGRVRRLPWLFAVTLPLLGGCYPYQAGDVDEVEVRVPVGTLGAKEEDLEGLRGLLVQRQDGLDAVFDLGAPRSNFYLGLSFVSNAGGSQPSVSGISSLMLHQDPNGFITELDVQVLVSPCPECVIKGIVFWSRDSRSVQTFSGSAPCDIESRQCALILDEQPTGNVMAHAVGGQEGLTLAALDAEELVRFPRAEAQDGAAGYYLMDAIPLNRPFMVQLDRGGGFVDVTGVVLTQEGERRQVDFDPESL